MGLTTESQYREPWHLVDEYNSTYWSGLDANVFFNGIHIEEIVQIQYQVVESVTPYYGYAYYTAQRMHRGQRIISGNFLINFKQSGYLFGLLETFKTNGRSSYFDPGTDPNTPLPPDSGDIEPSTSWNQAPSASQQTPPAKVGEVASFSGSKQKTFSPFESLDAAVANTNSWLPLIPPNTAANSNTQAASLDTKSFLETTRSKVESLSSQDNAPPADQAFITRQFAQWRAASWHSDPAYLSEKNRQFFGSNPSSRRPLYKGPKAGISVKIAYGNPMIETQTLRRNALGEYIRQGTDASYFGNAIVSTIDMLTGVEITGVTKVVDDSGRPVLEQYSFLARDYMDITSAYND